MFGKLHKSISLRESLIYFRTGLEQNYEAQLGVISERCARARFPPRRTGAHYTPATIIIRPLITTITITPPFRLSYLTSVARHEGDALCVYAVVPHPLTNLHYADASFR